MDRRPIGIFDSGLGGLTVVREVQKVLPGEEIIYFGDTARVPYGTKSKETVTRFSEENIRFLLRYRVKLIVVACNTASSLSLPTLVRSFEVPIIGVIQPGAYKALEITKKGSIGVIGTRATVSSGAYKRILEKANSNIKIISKACPLFVPLVEEGWLNNKITLSVVREYLKELKKEKVETLILGCTHYPLLKSVIKKVVGGDVKLVDSAHETARMVKDLLSKNGLISNRKRATHHKYFVSDEPLIFKKVGEMFLKGDIKYIRKV